MEEAVPQHAIREYWPDIFRGARHGKSGVSSHRWQGDLQPVAGSSAPLTRLLKKDAKFAFDDSARGAFEQIKGAFKTAQILKHFEIYLPTAIETDASDYAISAILSQYHGKILFPVAFMSRQMIPAERNYDCTTKSFSR